MPGTPASLPTAEYFCQLDGLSFTVQVYQLPDGSFEGKITVDEGSADFNAIYFGDGIDDGSSASLNGPLNMNNGSSTDWDQAVKLSSPGLGKLGADKPTFLSEGESFSFALDIDSLDEIADIGIRATSTSTPEGSIKCELTPVIEDEDEDYGIDYLTGPIGGNTDAQAVAPVAEVAAPVAEAAAPVAEAVAPVTEAAAPLAEAAAPVTDAAAPVVDAATPLAEAAAPVDEAETPTPALETPPAEAETSAAEPETPSAEGESEPAAETPAPVFGADLDDAEYYSQFANLIGVAPDEAPLPDEELEDDYAFDY